MHLTKGHTLVHVPSRRCYARMRALAIALLLLAGCEGGSRGAPAPPAVLAHLVRTEHFVVHNDLAPEARDFHVQLLEAFRAWFATRYFVPAPAAPLAVYLFSARADFVAFGERIGGPSSAGYFAELDNGTSVLVVDLSSGLGTMLHELVHAFVYQSFRPLPPRWFNEGLAAYHEKCLGCLDGSQLSASFGYFSNWRFPRLAAEVAAGRIHLSGLSDPQQDPTSAAAALMLFLDRHGKFVPFVQAMRTATTDHDGMQTLAAVWGADLADLEQRWLQWIREQPLGGEVGLVPATTILPPGPWAEWVAANARRMRWDPAVGRFVPTTQPK